MISIALKKTGFPYEKLAPKSRNRMQFPVLKKLAPVPAISTALKKLDPLRRKNWRRIQEILFFRYPTVVDKFPMWGECAHVPRVHTTRICGGACAADNITNGIRPDTKWDLQRGAWNTIVYSPGGQCLKFRPLIMF